MLNGELCHRMKNMLATIQAIAGQTFKDATDGDAVVEFRQRLQALSSAQDVLLQGGWSAAPIREVVTTTLRAFDQAGELEQPGRFAVAGPELTLAPEAVLSMSLLLHELATNAVKYGALSAEAGRVALTWRIDPDRAELVLGWRETGGPPAVEPTRIGFGTRLIRGGVAGTGNVALRYRATGFEAEVRARLDRVRVA